MARNCPRCGAENPDAAERCQSCGGSLMSVAAVLTSPAGFPSPNYVPSAPVPTAPVHRTRWSLIVGGMGVAVILAAVGGTAIALLGSHLNSPGSFIGIAASSPSPTPSPAPSDSPGLQGLPTPVISTAPIPAGPTQSNGAESLPVPAGWTVNSADSSTIVLDDPNGEGSVTVESGPSTPPKTAQQYRDSINAYFQARYPDAGPCPNSTPTAGTLNGVDGTFWILCFTMTAGGQSFPAATALFAGANAAGTVDYLVAVLASQANLQNFVSESKPIVQGIQWNLK